MSDKEQQEETIGSEEKSQPKGTMVLSGQDSLSTLATGASDQVALKVYEVFSSMEPEMQAIVVSPKESRNKLSNKLLSNVHKRRMAGGILGTGTGAASLFGGACVALIASNPVAIGISVSLVVGGFTLGAFGMQVLLGKAPSGKEAKELAGAVASQQSNSHKDDSNE